MVALLTAVPRAWRAVLTISRRNALSPSSGWLGSPHGWGILVPATTRFAPTCFATIVNAVMSATGMPCFSISFAITAPLRVSVPQVETSKTPLISCAFMSEAISLPTRSMSGIWANTPVVI